MRQQLVSMGEQGERALMTLDAAARKAAGTPGTASRSGASGGSGVAGLGTAFGAAGYQIQDFATQVSMGQNALTAFGAQASQFLGVFGTGGAVAGAVLTVGVLAANLLTAGESGAEAAKRIEEAFAATAKQTQDLAELVQKVADLFLTVDQRAAASAERSRVSLLEQSRAQLRFVSNEQTAAVSQMTAAEAELARLARNRERLERDLAGATPRTRGSIEGDLREARDLEFAARARRDAARSELDRTTGLVGSLGADITRLDSIRYGGTADQPQPPERASGGGGGRSQRDPLDVNAAVAQSLDELAARYDALNTAIAESESGMNGAAAATAEYEARLTTLREAVDAGLISEEEFQRQVERTTEALDRRIGEIESRGRRASDVTRELGLSFTSAFEDAIVKGKEFSDVLTGLGEDLARLLVRKAITEPAGNAISNFVGGINWGSLFSGGTGAGGVTATPSTGGISQNPFGFADGGVMTSRGPLRLRRYAGGGVADSPQVALFGEGDGPEAFVPLPDGRSIPVTMRGAGQGAIVFSPTYQIDARGADPSMVPRLEARMAAISQAAVADFANRINSGGSAARLVGRRA